MRGRALWTAFLGLVLAVGCSAAPTYPKARLAHDLQALFADDHLKTAVRVLNHTLAVGLEYPDTLSQHNGQLGIGPALDEAARKVITDIHRVLLSSDADVRFYVLLISDPKSPGVYFGMVRYMDDVRRANANMLDTPEILARTILDFKFVGPQRMPTIDQYVHGDIRLEEFLSMQLAQRIQMQLTADLQNTGVANVGPCGGTFEHGEFAFSLDVAPLTTNPLDERTIQKVFMTSTNVITKVLSSYHFDRFNAIRLIHPATGRMLFLPKARLDLFR